MKEDNALQAVHIQRINTVFEYIETHLDSPLPLEDLAKMAHYSPFHFHRIFKLITGESLHSYIKRRRMERAANRLMHHKALPIGDLYAAVGFSSLAAFSKAFKAYYGLSPRAFQQQTPAQLSKIGQVDRKDGQTAPVFTPYLYNIIKLRNWITMKVSIEVKHLEAQELAYVTSIGSQDVGAAYEALTRWAMPKGLLQHPIAKMVTVYHDSFKTTAADQVRISASLRLAEPIETIGIVGSKQLAAGRHIVGHGTLALNEFEEAWTGLFVWMQEQGYKKAEQPPFLVHYNNFNEHPERLATVDLCIPIH